MVWYCSHFHSGVADFCHKFPQSPFSSLERFFCDSLKQKLTHHSVHTTSGCGSVCHPHVDSTHIPSLNKFSWRRKTKPWKAFERTQGGEGEPAQIQAGQVVLSKPPGALSRYSRSEKSCAHPAGSIPKRVWEKSASEIKAPKEEKAEHRIQEGRRKEQEFLWTVALPGPSPGVIPALPGAQHLWDSTDLRHCRISREQPLQETAD